MKSGKRVERGSWKVVEFVNFIIEEIHVLATRLATYVSSGSTTATFPLVTIAMEMLCYFLPNMHAAARAGLHSTGKMITRAFPENTNARNPKYKSSQFLIQMMRG
jgi:hypothetical protein